MTTSVRRIGLGARINKALGRSWEGVEDAFGLQLDPWETAYKFFTFHRGKMDGRWGFSIWLHRGKTLPHGVNLTCIGIAPFHRRLADAEEWAGQFADEHGFEALKRVRPKPRRPRPRLSLIPGGAR